MESMMSCSGTVKMYHHIQQWPRNRCSIKENRPKNSLPFAQHMHSMHTAHGAPPPPHPTRLSIVLLRCYCQTCKRPASGPKVPPNCIQLVTIPQPPICTPPTAAKPQWGQPDATKSSAMITLSQASTPPPGSNRWHPQLAPAVPK